MDTNKTKKKWKELGIDALFDFAGAFLQAVGVWCFIEPSRIAPGGVSGIALMLNHLFALPIGAVSLVINIPLMLAAGHGKIINISSVWGCVGASCEVAYSATKGGINAFTQALAKELAPSNIQVNAVACGAIDTEMNQWMEEDELIGLVEEIPSGRLGRAEEVADFVYHLGYKGSYLTGQIIKLDGGWI